LQVAISISFYHFIPTQYRFGHRICNSLRQPVSFRIFLFDGELSQKSMTKIFFRKAKRLPNYFKLIALFLCACLILSDSLAYGMKSKHEQTILDPGSWILDKRQDPKAHFQNLASFDIPPQYGTIEEKYTAIQSENEMLDLKLIPPTQLPALNPQFPTSTIQHPKTIIYIQDAHDSLEAQENIARMIAHLVGKQGVKTVYEEGYEGPVPTDDYFSIVKDQKLRQKVSYFYMDKLRLGGAEFAHINRRKDFRLIGADRIKLHLENIRWYRRSAAHRREVQEDLDAIRSEMVRLSDRFFPTAMKEWLKLKERLDQNKISLLDYVKRLVELQNKTRILDARSWIFDKNQNPKLQIQNLATKIQDPFPSLSLLLAADSGHDRELEQQLQAIDPKTLFDEITQMENSFAGETLEPERDLKIFNYLRDLQLIRRLSEMTVSPAEFEACRASLAELDTKTLAEFIARNGGQTVVLSREWEDMIRDAIRFYDAARSRDAVIEQKLEAFAKNPDETTAVLVFGGFHKDKIRAMLQRLAVSYVIVAPKIASISPKHQQYYKSLMAGGRHNFETPLNVARAARVMSLPERAELRGDDAMRNEVLAVAEILAAVNSDLVLMNRAVEKMIIRGEMRKKAESDAVDDERAKRIRAAAARRGLSSDQEIVQRLLFEDRGKVLAISFEIAYGWQGMPLAGIDKMFLDALAGTSPDPRLLTLLQSIQADPRLQQMPELKPQVSLRSMRNPKDPVAAVEAFLAAEETRKYFERLSQTLPLSYRMKEERKQIAQIPSRVTDAMGPGFKDLNQLLAKVGSWLRMQDGRSVRPIGSANERIARQLINGFGWISVHEAVNASILAPFIEELIFRLAIPVYIRKQLGMKMADAQVVSNYLFSILHGTKHQGKFDHGSVLGWLATNISLQAAFSAHAFSNFLLAKETWESAKGMVGAEGLRTLRDLMIRFAPLQDQRTELRQGPEKKRLGRMSQKVADLSRVYLTLLFGGLSSRFGPLDKLKFDPNGHGTIGQQTVDRYTKTFGTGRYDELFGLDQLSALIVQNDNKDLAVDIGIAEDNIFSQPERRSTFSAMLWRMAHLRAHEDDDDATLVFSASDHFVPAKDIPKFRATIEQAVLQAQQQDAVVGISIQPDDNLENYTRYGNLQINRKTRRGPKTAPAYEIVNFKEKPELEIAAQMMIQGNWYWDIGLYAFRLSVGEKLIKALWPKEYQEIYLPMVEALKKASAATSVRDKAKFLKRAQTLFKKTTTSMRDPDPTMRNFEVESSIANVFWKPLITLRGGLKKIGVKIKPLTVLGTFTWADIGSWGSMRDIKDYLKTDARGNVLVQEKRGNVRLGRNVKQCIVVAERGAKPLKIDVSGPLENMIIIFGQNGHVFVAPVEKAGLAKNFSQFLIERKFNKLRGVGGLKLKCSKDESVTAIEENSAVSVRRLSNRIIVAPRAARTPKKTLRGGASDKTASRTEMREVVRTAGHGNFRVEGRETVAWSEAWYRTKIRAAYVRIYLKKAMDGIIWQNVEKRRGPTKLRRKDLREYYDALEDALVGPALLDESAATERIRAIGLAVNAAQQQLEELGRMPKEMRPDFWEKERPQFIKLNDESSETIRRKLNTIISEEMKGVTLTSKKDLWQKTAARFADFGPDGVPFLIEVLQYRLSMERLLVAALSLGMMAEQAESAVAGLAVLSEECAQRTADPAWAKLKIAVDWALARIKSPSEIPSFPEELFPVDPTAPTPKLVRQAMRQWRSHRRRSRRAESRDPLAEKWYRTKIRAAYVRIYLRKAMDGINWTEANRRLRVTKLQRKDLKDSFAGLQDVVIGKPLPNAEAYADIIAAVEQAIALSQQQLESLAEIPESSRPDFWETERPEFNMPDQETSATIQRKLGAIMDHELRGIHPPYEAQRWKSAAALLADLGPEALPFLTAEVRQRISPESVMLAVLALGMMGDQAAPAGFELERLKSESVERVARKMRWRRLGLAASWALARIKASSKPPVPENILKRKGLKTFAPAHPDLTGIVMGASGQQLRDMINTFSADSEIKPFHDEQIAGIRQQAHPFIRFDRPEDIFRYYQVKPTDTGAVADFVQHLIREYLPLGSAGDKPVFFTEVKVDGKTYTWLAQRLGYDANRAPMYHEKFYMDRKYVGHGRAESYSDIHPLRMRLDAQRFSGQEAMDVFFRIRQNFYATQADPKMFYIPKSQFGEVSPGQEWNAFFFYVRRGYLPVDPDTRKLVIDRFVKPWLASGRKLHLPDPSEVFGRDAASFIIRCEGLALVLKPAVGAVAGRYEARTSEKSVVKFERFEGKPKRGIVNYELTVEKDVDAESGEWTDAVIRLSRGNILNAGYSESLFPEPMVIRVPLSLGVKELSAKIQQMLKAIDEKNTALTGANVREALSQIQSVYVPKPTLPAGAQGLIEKAKTISLIADSPAVWSDNGDLKLLKLWHAAGGETQRITIDSPEGVISRKPAFNGHFMVEYGLSSGDYKGKVTLLFNGADPQLILRGVKIEITQIGDFYRTWVYRSLSDGDPRPNYEEALTAWFQLRIGEAWSPQNPVFSRTETRDAEYVRRWYEGIEPFGLTRPKVDEVLAAYAHRSPDNVPKAMGFREQKDIVQLDVLKSDFKHFIKTAEATGRREVVFVTAGLGNAVPVEALTVLDLFLSALNSHSENPKLWHVYFLGLEPREESIRFARTTFDYILKQIKQSNELRQWDEREVDGFLDHENVKRMPNDDRLVAGILQKTHQLLAPDHLKLVVEKADSRDVALLKAIRSKYEAEFSVLLGADYFLERNMSYTVQEVQNSLGGVVDPVQMIGRFLLVGNNLTAFAKAGTRYIQEADARFGDHTETMPWPVVRFPGSRVMKFLDYSPVAILAGRPGLTWLSPDYPAGGIANIGSGINVVEDLDAVLNMRFADFLNAIINPGRDEMRTVQDERRPAKSPVDRFDSQSTGHNPLTALRPGQHRNLREVLAAMSKGQGTVLISKVDLAKLGEAQWTSLCEALYKLSGIRCVVYGEGDESDPDLQFRLAQLSSGKFKGKVVPGGPSAVEALKRAVPGRQSVFLSIEGLDKKTVDALGSSELIKAVKLGKDYDLPWLAALYAVANGQLQGVAVVNDLYLEDRSGWYRAEIREYMANQVIAWAA
jgi:mannose-1-phosphate guanylyltransferase